MIHCAATIASLGERIDGAGRLPDTWSRETERWSACFLVNWEFVDNFTVAVEGRHPNEDLGVAGPNRLSPPGLPLGRPNQVLSTRSVNASAAEIWGPQLDVRWAITMHPGLSASHTYLDTEYTDCQILNGDAAPIPLAGSCTVFEPPGDDPNRLLDYSGRRLGYAAENAFVGSLSYHRAFNRSFDWFVEGELINLDQRYHGNANRVRFNAYRVVNSRFGAAGEWWDVLASVDDAFENEAVQTGFRSICTPAYGFASGGPQPFTMVLPSSFPGVMPDPRQWGVRVNYRFGLFEHVQRVGDRVRLSLEDEAAELRRARHRSVGGSHPRVVGEGRPRPRRTTRTGDRSRAATMASRQEMRGGPRAASSGSTRRG